MLKADGWYEINVEGCRKGNRYSKEHERAILDVEIGIDAASGLTDIPVGKKWRSCML